VDEGRATGATGADGTDPAVGPPGEDVDDVAHLRRERDALAARVETLERRRERRARVRHGIVAVLLVLGIAASTASVTGWWARRNLANTDVWIERVGPLPQDPAVHAAISKWLGDQVVQLVDPQKLFAEVLPERGRLLAVPLGNAVEGFVRDRVDTFVGSERFARLWVAANDRAHTAVLRVLRGQSDLVQAQDGRVVIDLVPAIDAVLADIGSASPDILGRQVDIPEVSLDDVPDVAIQRLETALGVSLDDDFGQFVIYDHGRLQALQDGLERARRWLVILSVTAVVSLAGALWFSDRRRRTLLQMTVGLAVGLALIRRLGIRGQRELLDAIPDTTNRDAAHAVSDRFLDPLLAVTKDALVVLALVALVALVTGPYPWAVRVREGAVSLARSTRAAVSRATSGAGTAAGQAGADGEPGAAADDVPTRVITWARANASTVRAGGLVLVVLVLLVADLSFLGLIVLAALVALGAAVLRSGDVAPPPAGPASPAGVGAGGDVQRTG
jgi:hypothetical protein